MTVTWLTSKQKSLPATRRHPSRIAATVALLLAVATILPASAIANAPTQIINRCAHGESVSGYTAKQYQRALEEPITELWEYTDCQEVIQQAELAATAHTGAASGGQVGGAEVSPGASGAPEPTAIQQHILEATRRERLAPVRLVGGGTVQPGVVDPGLASAASDLPAPLLAVIALVMAGLVLLAGKEIKEHIARSQQR